MHRVGHRHFDINWRRRPHHWLVLLRPDKVEQVIQLILNTLHLLCKVQVVTSTYLVRLMKILQQTIDVVGNNLTWGNNPRNFFAIE
jgi:hypothetical protein